MDEFDSMHYNVEPINEPQQEPIPEPANEPMQEPVYEAPAPVQTEAPQPPVYPPYEHQPPKKKKKDRTAWKLVAVVAAVALVASIGGTLITNMADRLYNKNQEENVPSISAPAEQEEPETEQDGYSLTEHKLPDQLNSNNAEKSMTPVQVYEATVNSVVGIQTEITTNVFGQEAVSASSGSGFILTEDGYVITNHHVIAGADTIKVSMFSGDIYDAELVASDSSFDVAVLKVDAKNLPAVKVGDSDKLKVGEEVAAIGNPLGELTFTMTNGILSALDREINTDGNIQNMLQTNAAINSGNSGGPLFDMDGNVIGVTTAKYSGSSSSGTIIEGLGFAIPINTALKVAYDLVDYGYVKGQAYLGVTVKTLASDMADYYSLPVGPRVEDIVEGSCAEKAGLQIGDIILKCNDVETRTNAELQVALKKYQAGDTVTLHIFRAGAELDVTVTLDEKPSQTALDAQVEEYEQNQQQPPQTQEPEQAPQQPDSYYYEFPFDQFPFDFFS